MIALVEPQKRESGSVLDEPVSASRLNCFHSCRLKFFYRYIQKLTKPVSGALFVGQAVHHALQQWSNRRWKGISATSDEIRQSYEDYWKEEEQVDWEEGEKETQRGKAWGLIEHYLSNTPIPVEEKPMAVEVSVEADLSSFGFHSLRGIIDLVRPGGTIVDFKTTAATPNEEQVLHKNEIQLTAYGLLYREATGEKESGFELHHLIKTKVPKLIVTKHDPISEKQRSRLFRSIDSYMGGVEREDYVPSPGLQCAACEFFNECRKGVEL